MMEITISELRIEAYNAIKNYIDFQKFIEVFSGNYSDDCKEIAWFLLANKFDEKLTFYEVNEFSNIRKLDTIGNNAIKSYLMGLYNGDISPIEIPEDNEDFEFRNICVNIDELRELPYLQGKINFDDLILDFTDYNSDIPQPPTNPHDIKARLSKEQADNYRLSQENAKLKAQIASFTDNHNQPQTGETITPANNDSEPTETPTLDGRTENAYLLTIGILLDLLTTPKGIKDRPTFPSQSAIISEITDRQLWGQGKATLEKRFKQANDSLKQAKKIK